MNIKMNDKVFCMFSGCFSDNEFIIGNVKSIVDENNMYTINSPCEGNTSWITLIRKDSEKYKDFYQSITNKLMKVVK